MDKQLRINLLNQNVNEAESTINALRAAGFSVRCQKIRDTDAFARSLNEECPDLILLDAVNSPVNVPAAVQSVKHAQCTTPVVVVGGMENLITYLQQGAQDVIDLEDPDLMKLLLQRAMHAADLARRLKQCRTTLSETERRARAVLETSRDAISYVHDGMHLYANNAYLKLFQFKDLDDVAGLPILDMVCEEKQEEFKKFLRYYSSKERGTQKFESCLKDTKGKAFSVSMEFAPASIEGEVCTQITIHYSDTELAETDSVTGLKNAAFFMGRLATAAERATKENYFSALLRIEVNNFAAIRGLVGVVNSNDVLKEVGQAIKEYFASTTAVAARFDGATFAVIAPPGTDVALRKSAEALVSKFEEMIIQVGGQSITCNLVVGIAIIDESADPEEVLSRSERALNAARKAVRSVEIYQPKKGEMSQRQLDRMWQEDLGLALREKRMQILYQPLVSLGGDNLARYEVFMRMLDKGGKTVSPMDFLPSAERIGIARDLDLWVLQTALSSVQTDAAVSPEPTTLFIKLTSSSLHDPKVQGWLLDYLQRNPDNGKQLVVELKESTVKQYLKDAKVFLPKLQEYECHIALDEFGETGDSFALLKHLDVKYLKLAASFMGGLRHSTENQKTVEQLTQQAHGQGKQVIAQKIDDAQELQLLWGIGVDLIQGNFLQPPSPERNYDFSIFGG